STSPCRQGGPWGVLSEDARPPDHSGARRRHVRQGEARGYREMTEFSATTVRYSSASASTGTTATPGTIVTDPLSTPVESTIGTSTPSSTSGYPRTRQISAFPPFASTTRFRSAPRRPWPAFGDVPVGHPQFQFVEALKASGITGGCGNYCP